MKLYPYQQQYLDFLLSNKDIKCIIKGRQIGYSHVEQIYKDWLDMVKLNNKVKEYEYSS